MRTSFNTPTIGATVPQTPPGSRSWRGPRGHWLTGCSKQIRTDPLHFYRDTWLEYGDYALLRAFAGIYLPLLSHPDAVEYVLQKNARNYRKPEVFNRPVNLLTGNGLLTSEGDFWLRQR